MNQHVRMIFIAFVSLSLTIFATATKADILYDCSTVADDIYQGVILEWDPYPGTGYSAVGISYVELWPGEMMTFTVTQVSGGPTPVEFRGPFSPGYQTGVTPTTFTFIAQEHNVYDIFEVKVADYSTGQVRVNWECGDAPSDGHIHDGRLNSGDLGTLTV